MNLLQRPSDDKGRARWLKIAGVVWLLLASVLAVVNSVGLARLIEQSRTSARDAQVQALGTRVAELEQQADAAKRRPRPLVQTDLDAARQALEKRLSQVEQAQETDAGYDGLQALAARVGAIEVRLKTPPRPAAAPRKTVEAVQAAKPEALEPPFNVVGVELRGGERFLSVVAPKATSVRDLRLLREGDAVGAWQLQALESRAAVFRVDGQTLRVALP